MPISWNEVRERAASFSKAWEGVTSESAEAKTFWDEFFNVFGISRRRVASFEEPVTKGDGRGGFIDLLWRGVLLVEHKSTGRDLERAAKQALDYFPGLKERELPQYVVVSDFKKIRLYDLDSLDSGNTFLEFPLTELYKHVKAFGFMMGFRTLKVAPEAPVNLRAVQRLSVLHDKLEAANYKGRALESLLTRLVFCFFADDTSIFEKAQFQEWVSRETSSDGSDVGARINELFDVLNQPEKQRSSLLSESLGAFPYVNGGLFAERFSPASFNSELREALLAAAALEWSQISPAIFGALFQGLMTRSERRRLGAHYTREKNILRLIKPLFLDDLWTEFEAAGSHKPKLQVLHQKLRSLKFFDPACGCGNFLVVTYREIRALELQILRRFYDSGRQKMLPAELDASVWVNVDQFYGLEIDEKAAHIARLAMWLTDHQMNLQIGEEFGTYFRRLPLSSSANVEVCDALAKDWSQFLKPSDGLVYLMGNPPFVGSKNLESTQRAAANRVFRGIHGAGTLDFVAAWYVQAARYIRGTNVRCGFVSTNSITQGEQVGILWGWLLSQGCKIHFAHRTFLWSNEARGPAAVHCVIIAFGMEDVQGKVIFEYEDLRGEPRAVPARNINPYLVDADDLVLSRRRTPLCQAPALGIGNKPIDGGHYLFTRDEKESFLQGEPTAERLFHRWIGSKEFINGIERWCLLVNRATPSELRRMPAVMHRIEAVKNFRLGTGPDSAGKLAKKIPPVSTQQLASSPMRFHVECFPDENYLVMPETSSERREYIPIDFVAPAVLPSSLLRVAQRATLFHFGVLTSAMHNAWVRYTCGRLKSDYRYSVSIVYNNFPWPSARAGDSQLRIEEAAAAILKVREGLTGQTLADLYDPRTMPTDLLRAHKALDRAVDALYGRSRGFKSEAERVVFLFDRYRTLTAPKEQKSLKAA